MDQPASQIIEQANKLVSQLVRERGHCRPPFSPIEIARLVGITKIKKNHLGKAGGLLLKQFDEYTIVVNEDDSLTRQNFSCAHEIGHVLSNQLHLEQYIKTIEYRKTFSPEKERKAQASTRERLCDIAATELLMPTEIFRSYLSNLGASITSIQQLAYLFQVSITAAAIRITQVSQEPHMVIKWNPWPTITKPNGLISMWQTMQSQGMDRRCYKPLNRIADKDSPLFKAYKECTVEKSLRSFKLGNKVTSFHLESKGFGNVGNRFVLSLASPSTIDSNNQVEPQVKN